MTMAMVYGYMQLQRLYGGQILYNTNILPTPTQILMPKNQFGQRNEEINVLVCIGVVRAFKV